MSPGRSLGNQQGLELGSRVQFSKPELGPWEVRLWTILCVGRLLTLDQHTEEEESEQPLQGPPQSLWGMQPSGLPQKHTDETLIHCLCLVRTVSKTGCNQHSLEASQGPSNTCGEVGFACLLVARGLLWALLWTGWPSEAPAGPVLVDSRQR